MKANTVDEAAFFADSYNACVEDGTGYEFVSFIDKHPDGDGKAGALEFSQARSIGFQSKSPANAQNPAYIFESRVGASGRNTINAGYTRLSKVVWTEECTFEEGTVNYLTLLVGGSNGYNSKCTRQPGGLQTSYTCRVIDLRTARSLVPASYAAIGTRPDIVVEGTTRTPSSSSGGGSESVPSCLNNPTIVCTDSSTNTKSSWCSSGSMSFRDSDGRTYYGSVTSRTDDETLVSYTNGDKQKCTKQRSSELFTERWLCYFSNDSDLDTKHDATCRRASAANDAEGAAGLDQCRLPEDQRSGWVNGDLSGVGIGGTNKAIRTCLDNGCSCEHRNPMLPGRTCIATPYGQEPTCE